MKLSLCVILSALISICYSRMHMGSMGAALTLPLVRRGHESRHIHKTTLEVVASTKAVVPAKKKPVWRTLTPVLMSAFLVAAIMYPLDLVRALQMANASSGVKLSTLQLLSNFKQAHGFKGFFTQGLVPELVRSTWMRFIKFSLYPIIHLTITGLDEKNGSSISRAISAILTSIPETTSIMPLEIAKLAIQLDNVNRFKNNMITAMSMMFKERGLNIFFMGYFEIQLRQALWSVGYFTTINIFQENLNKAVKKIAGPDYKIEENPSLKVILTVMSGFLAGVVGGLMNSPMDAIRTIIQKNIFAQPPGAIIPNNTFLAVGKDIVAKRGFGGLYAGIVFKSLHLGGGGALMAVFLPFFNNLVNKGYMESTMAATQVSTSVVVKEAPIVVTVDKKSTKSSKTKQ